MDIKITKLHRVKNSKAVKAFADLLIDDCLLIKGFIIIKLRQELFVSCPKSQAKDNHWYDIVQPMTKECKEEIERIILEAYNS